MTIETRVETTASAKAAGFRYVQSDSIAVVSVIGERSDLDTRLGDVLRACVARFTPYLRNCLSALPGAQILLFVATPVAGEHNAVARRRGCWGVGDLRWLPPTGPRSPSVEVSAREGGTRFIGLAVVPDESFFEAAEFVRTHGTSFLLICSMPGLLEEHVRTIAQKVFPAGEAAIDWTHATALAEDEGCICIRVSGGFDDREAAIDAFLRDDLRTHIEATEDDLD